MQRDEGGAVAAERDQHVAVGGLHRLRDLPLLVRQSDLPQANPLLLTPAGEQPEHPVEVAAGVDDQAQPTLDEVLHRGGRV